MFFDGEGAGVERPSVPERVELLFGEDTREDVTCWKGDELDHDAGDKNRSGSFLSRFFLVVEGRKKIRTT